MSRLAASVAALTAAIGTPALAADWGNDWEPVEVEYRDAYGIEPKDWTEFGDQTDGVHLETGIRYWYSFGSQSVESGGITTSATDTAHIGELHLRVEDDMTATWGQAMVGYSMAISGTFDGPFPGDIGDGSVGYAGADFGWKALDDGKGNGIGGLIGYLYWNDSPDTGRNNFTTATSADDITVIPGTGQTILPGDSAPNHIETHALRLGVEGKAKFGDIFDIRAHVAAVPYAKVAGVVGADDPSFNDDVWVGPAQFPYGDEGATGNISGMRSSETAIDGWGYGAMAEGWIGVEPIDNLVFRLGGRAWYLQGTADATYTRAIVGNPTDTDGEPGYEGQPSFENVGVIDTNNPFALFRYGLLAELTYSF